MQPNDDLIRERIRRCGTISASQMRGVRSFPTDIPSQSLPTSPRREYMLSLPSISESHKGIDRSLFPMDIRSAPMSTVSPKCDSPKIVVDSLDNGNSSSAYVSPRRSFDFVRGSIVSTFKSLSQSNDILNSLGGENDAYTKELENLMGENQTEDQNQIAFVIPSRKSSANGLKREFIVKKTLPMRPRFATETSRSFCQSTPVTPRTSLDETQSYVTKPKKKSLLKSSSAASFNQQVLKNITRVRKDVVSACRRLVMINKTMGESVENLLHRPAKQQTPPLRRLKVIQDERQRKSSVEKLMDKGTIPKTHGGCELGLDFTSDLTNATDLTPSLVLTSLKDGKFQAQVSLQDVPEGDVSLCISNNQLLIISGLFLQHEAAGQQPSLCAFISIPIYVLSHSMQFKFNDREVLLYMEGDIKC